MSSQPNLLFDGTAPANASHYSVQKSGNNVVLHFSASSSPTVIFVTATNTIDGATNAARWQTVTVYATVSAGAGTITNVSVNLSAIGGPAAQVMSNLGGNHYSFTAAVGAGALVGNDVITVTAKDTTPLAGSGSATIFVSPTTATWDGLAADNNWGSGTNWVGNNPPGFSGDSLIFAGSTRTTPNMNNNYAVAALTFDGTAGSFNIASGTGSTLTLNGTFENDSANPQTLSVPIVLGATETINDAANGGISLGGAVSGAGGLTVGSADGRSTRVGVGLSGSGTVDNTSATTASTLTLGNNNNTISLSGLVVQNSGGANLALVKVGTGDMALPSPNTYAGGTTVSNGSATIGNNTGAGTGTITLAGGTLFNNATINIANNILAQAGTISIIDNANGNNLTLSGGFLGSGTLTRGSSQTMSVYLAGDNSGFTGTYQDQNNANSITRYSVATAGSAGAHWIFNQAQNLTRTALQFSGGTISFGSISGAGFLSENGAFVNTVEVGALGLNDTFSGSFQDNGGTLSLNKVGTGTLTLRGPNAYSGLTTVVDGALVISTAHLGNGNFVVNDGKTLGAINNGGVQTALLGSLTLGDTAGPTTLFFTNVASTITPVITVAGAVTRNGTCSIAISNSLLNSGSVYPLVKYGSLAGGGNFVLSSVPSGVTASLTNDTSNVWIALKVSVGNNVNTNPTNITSTVSGSVLSLSWPSDHLGWTLQTNSVGVTVANQWFPIPGSASVTSTNLTISPSNTNVFFRLVYP